MTDHLRPLCPHYRSPQRITYSDNLSSSDHSGISLIFPMITVCFSFEEYPLRELNWLSFLCFCQQQKKHFAEKRMSLLDKKILSMSRAFMILIHK